MTKNNSYKRRLKYVFLAFACAASFTMTGLAAACAKDEEKDEEKTTSVEDTQLLKNGNFEFFNVPDKNAEYLIKTPLNWSRAGDSSYTMSGIIGTSKKAWEKLTDSSLAETLDKNNDLDSSAEDYKDKYIDYNGMHSYDILYENSYEAINVDKVKDDDKEWSDERRENAKNLISNPGTHYAVNKDTLTCADGTKVYEDEKGDWFFDAEFKQPMSNILMIHNYADNHNGLAQRYTSDKVELPANTAAEISLWVKTVGLRYDKGEKVEQDLGANITVKHTAGSSTLDDFKITAINTEKLLGDTATNNGWVQYTVYVNACDFANTTVSIELGLGETGNLVEGYAFFDDVTVTKYASLDDISSYDKGKLTVGDKTASCDLSSTADEKIFIADANERNGGSVKDDNYSKNFYYLLDLASTEEYTKISLSGAKAGLTVDEDGYASALVNPHISGLTVAGLNNAKLPKDFEALRTDADTVACVTPGDSMFPMLRENADLSAALKNAKDLPSANDSTQVLAMYSAFGAAYNANLGDIEIPANGYRIVSFWIKTSEQNAGSSANIKIYATNDKDNSSSLSVNTKGVTVDIDDDNKDIYGGWVQCFFFVHNDTEKANHYTIEFSYGVSAIKDTAVKDYKNGWIALANMRQLDVEEDVFNYTSSNTYAATLTLTVEEESYTKAFDEVYGAQSNQIKNDIVNANNYKGVNGGSSTVVHNGTVSLPFDDTNTNPNAGLINKEYFEKYSGNAWYNTLLDCFDASGIKATDAWDKIFGNSSYQPLVIINDGARESFVNSQGATESNYKDYYIYNEQTGIYEHPTKEYDEKTTYYSAKQVFNYGFIGNENTVASDSYNTVSVRVKVSKGAVAYVYLTNAKGEKNVLGFTAPAYTFLYDEDGNVIEKELDNDASLAQQRANIVYTVRGDGLYEDKSGKLFANIYNYKRLYKDATKVYYNAQGQEVSFDDLSSDVIYYSDAAHTKQANCYLVATDGTRVYEVYENEFYYLVNGKRADKVNAFDTKYARYDYSELNGEYFACIDGRDESVANKWITVTFAIHTGNESKNYRLELWSGNRESTGVDADGNVVDNASKSAVIFDYSYYSITESEYDGLRSEYEKAIKDAYLDILAKNDLLANIKSPDENIDYYKSLVDGYIEEGKLNSSVYNGYDVIKNSAAKYYTFSLYDSAQYIPFNENTAKDGETGYNYDKDSFTETLAYLSVKNSDSYTVFADYATVNQKVDRTTASDDDNKDDDKTDSNSDSNVWLLASSIVLVVVLLFAIAAIFIKDALKKSRRNKTQSKNTYQQRNRYIRKLHIQKENIEEVDRNEGKTETEEPAVEETPVEEQPAQEPATEEAPAEEQPAEETPVEEVAPEEPAQEAPVEKTTEQPTEDTSAKEPETAQDDEQKDGE